MKKFFSLLCAMMLVLSVSAKPFATKKAASNSMRPSVGAMDVRQGLAHKAMKKAAAPAAFVNSYDVPFANLSDYTQVAGQEWFQMMGDTEDGAYSVSICVNTDHMVGTFTTEDIDFDYTGIGEYASQEMLEVVAGDVAVSLDNDTVFLEATLSDANGVEYFVTMKHFVPSKDDMVTIAMDVADYDDSYAAYGLLYLYAMTADQQNYIEFGVWSDASDFAGSYTDADLDTYLSSPYVLVNGAELSIMSADFTITNDGTTIAVEGDFLASNGEWYHITFSFAFSGGGSGSGNEYDMQEDVTVAFAAADIETFEVDATEGYAYIRLLNANNETFSTLIYVSGSTLPAGTYPIDESFAPGSAQSGDLDATQGSVYPTYYATLDAATGYLNVPLFLCVDGTVTVSYDAAGNLELDVVATNTWGNSIHVTLGAPTAVENVEAAVKAQKSIENGQLVIEKNGVRYNAQGAQL